MDVLQKIITDYQPRTLIYSSNEEALVLYAPKQSTRLTFLYNTGSNVVSSISTPYIVEASNQSLYISKSTTDIARFHINSDTGTSTGQLTIYGNSTANTFKINPGQESSKAIVLQDYNILSGNQFAGFGYQSGIMNYQLPLRSGKYIFKAAAADSVNAEWMRIQEDSGGKAQVGIGTYVLSSNVSLTVRGDAIIDGRLTVQGGITFDSSQFVKVDPNTYRLSSNQLPQNVPLLNANTQKVDESVLPTSYNFQYLKTQKNVGIGTRNPQQKFHVHGSVAFSERLGIGTIYPSNRLHVIESSASISTAKFENNSSGNVIEAILNGSPAFTVVGTHAAVGIGTNVVNPSYKLQVEGNTIINGMLSCSNFTAMNKLTVQDLEVRHSDGTLMFGKELLEVNNIIQPYVRSRAPYIFEQGIATTLITSTQSAGTVNFPNTGINVDGDAIFKRNPIISSDMRYKFDIERVNNAIDKLNDIHGYTYHLGDGQRLIGVLAQEVMMTLPEAVSTVENRRMGVRYDCIIPILIECIHELKSRLNMVESRLP